MEKTYIPSNLYPLLRTWSQSSLAWYNNNPWASQSVENIYVKQKPHVVMHIHVCLHSCFGIGSDVHKNLGMIHIPPYAYAYMSLYIEFYQAELWETSEWWNKRITLYDLLGFTRGVYRRHAKVAEDGQEICVLRRHGWATPTKLSYIYTRIYIHNTKRVDLHMRTNGIARGIKIIY